MCKEKQSKNYAHYHALDLMWSCKFHITSKTASSWSILFPHAFVCTVRQNSENKTNANILEAELFFYTSLYLTNFSELKAWDFYPGTAEIFSKMTRTFPKIPEDIWKLPKTSENFWRHPKTSEDIGSLWKTNLSRKCFNHMTLRFILTKFAYCRGSGNSHGISQSQDLHI